MFNECPKKTCTEINLTIFFLKKAEINQEIFFLKNNLVSMNTVFCWN